MEKINKSLKENQKETIKQVKQMFQDLNTEIEAIKNHKLRKFWIWKIWVNKRELQSQA